MKNFTIVRRQNGEVDVLELGGRITLGESSRELRRVLEEMGASGRSQIILDMASVSHLDSSGLGSLLVGHKAVRNQGGFIRLVRPSQHVRELLELSRLTAVFQAFESDTEAVLAPREKPPLK